MAEQLEDYESAIVDLAMMQILLCEICVALADQSPDRAAFFADFLKRSETRLAAMTFNPFDQSRWPILRESTRIGLRGTIAALTPTAECAH